LSASTSAIDAAAVEPGGDMSAALTALSHVVENYATCHAAYQLK
jgi:hypothetical protein